MPTINAFYSDEKIETQLVKIIDDLKSFAAKELTCGDISLESNEISVRLIKVAKIGMLAELELEITAHAYDERVKSQDDICLSVRNFLMSDIEASDVRVWLLLPQLGHSWE